MPTPSLPPRLPSHSCGRFMSCPPPGGKIMHNGYFRHWLHSSRGISTPVAVPQALTPLFLQAGWEQHPITQFSLCHSLSEPES